MPEGPTTRHRQLGFRLHALREGSGLTAEEAGRRAGVSKATVSRYERAKGTVRWSHVDQLCRVHGLPDAEREALVELAKHSTETDGWWVSQADNLPEKFFRDFQLCQRDFSGLFRRTDGEDRDRAEDLGVAGQSPALSTR
nr:helix-turn-helix transcriptional regulator [Streptomyces xiaopingdaonensis]